MSPYYYDDLPTNVDDEMLMTFLVIFLAVLGVVLLFALAFWIIRSLSLMKLAKRRGIQNAWLAWIPIGNYWVLGSVADQYQHLVHGKVTSRRKIMLILAAVGTVVSTGYSILSVVQTVLMETGEDIAALTLISVPVYLLTMGVSITSMVFYHICNYDLYRSCNPNNAVTFLVLGIIFSVCEPFFYLSCRNKDLGMILPQTMAVPQTAAPVVPAEPAELPPVDPEI